MANMSVQKREPKFLLPNEVKAQYGQQTPDPLAGLNQDFLLAQADSAELSHPEEAAQNVTGEVPPPAAEPVESAQPSQADLMRAQAESLPVTKFTEKTTTLTPDEDIDKQIAEIEAQHEGRITDALKAQRENLEKMVQQHELLGQEDLPMDLTGLMALTDAWTGSKFAQSYKPPESRAERKVLMSKLQDQITQAKEGMSKSEIDYLGEKLKAKLSQKASMIRQEMSQVRGVIGQQKDKETQAYKSDKDLEKDIQKLQARLGSTNLYTNLEKLNGILAEYPKGKDIPGVGPGQMFVPDFMRGEKESEINQLAYNLVSDLIKMQSGLAASEAEVKRKMKELGLSTTAKDSSFIRGLHNVRDKMLIESKQVEAAFKPEAVSRFRSRGGKGSKEIEQLTGSGGGSSEIIEANKKKAQEMLLRLKEQQGGK